MQGIEDSQKGFLDVESVAGHLLKSGSVFAFLALNRCQLFPDSEFADLFSSGRGRRSLPGSVIASVLVLQTLFGLSDRETVEALTYDLRWKSACGFAVDAPGIDHSTLGYWRLRLAKSNRPHRIFEAVNQVIIESDVIKGKSRRAVDSTVMDDAVARQDTVTQLMAQIRRVGREVDGAGELIPVVCTRLCDLTGFGYDQVGRPRIDWEDVVARENLISALVNDALALLGALDVEAINLAGGKSADAVALLALVAGQDVEPAEDSNGLDGRWRIARSVASERVISTVDIQARHARKTREDKRDGFKAHIIVEPDTGLFTGAKITEAAGPTSSDATVGQELLAADTTIEPGEHIEVLGDSAYASAAMLEAVQAAGHIAIMKPKPLIAAVPGGFSVDDFAYDAEKNTVTCPAGNAQKISKTGAATFSVCRACPLREQCTKSANRRVIRIDKHFQLRQKHREKAKGKQFNEIYRNKRPMVERNVAWFTRKVRHLRYIGVAKNNAWALTRAAAINLRQLVNLGLENQSGKWVIA